MTSSTSKPLKNREETFKSLENILNGPRQDPCNVYGSGPLLISDIPEKARPSKEGGGVIMGIDEAGRGPVLGPMTYAAAYWNPDDSDAIPNGFKDSKTLNPSQRASLFTKLKETPQIGFVLRVLHASEISRNMLRKEPYNLNAMSHDSAMEMIQAVLDAGVKIDTCYVDTVGVASSYRAKLDREFEGHNIEFVVEKKADDKYAPCSAASIVAKVSRDTITESWTWTEGHFEAKGGNEYGSGYPSDPKCKAWMEQNLSHPVFAYPDFVRFSWGPAKKSLKEDCTLVEWEADEDDEENGSDGKGQQMSMNFFVVAGKGDKGKQPPRKKRRAECFEKLGLSKVTNILNM